MQIWLHRLWVFAWRLFFVGIVLSLLPLLVFFVDTREHIYDVADSPTADVAIVFGAAARGGKPSDIFADRLRTAADLYLAGKVDEILVSGDNSQEKYNEPQAGKNLLLELGVPEDDIHLDYAGFRTYDTCARAVDIFDVKSGLLVTQRYHLPRALFICNRLGISVDGVPADRQRYLGMPKYYIREIAGRILTFYEVMIFRHEPTAGGEQIDIFEE